VSHSSDQDLLAAMAGVGGFTTFLSLAKQAGLAKQLKGPGRYTLFAPTDEAFAKVSAGVLDKLKQPSQRDLLKAIVAMHLVTGQVLTPRLAGRRIRGKSAHGAELVINGAKAITVNGAAVVRPDIVAANGVIHGIDRVLWPKLAAQSEHAVSE
jgi:uncharacterized surface protein with fasciclin (FAS1) repeats